MTTQPSFHLRLLGGASLTGPDGRPLGGRAAHRHRLAILAMLARAPDRGVSRDLLMAQLWPESDVDQARNLLKVSVYVLRQALGERALVSIGGTLRLDTTVVDVDVLHFESALAGGDHERAVSLYGGPFLEAFFLRDAPEFEHWVDRERAALADAQASALEALALAAEARGDGARSVEWWKARAGLDPFDSSVALSLMRALVTSGNRAGAITHARVHARLLSGELGLEPPPELAAYVERLSDGTHIAPPAEPGPPPRAVTPRPEPATASVAVAEVSGPPDGWEQSAGWTQRRSLWPRSSTRARRGLGLAGLGVAVAAALLVAVPDDDARPRSAFASTADVVAWELYERASRPEMLRSDSSAREALDLFTTAVDLDPGFAAAHAGLARMLLRVGWASDPERPNVGWLELARRHATTATRLDPLLAEAYGTLGVVEMMLYRFEEADLHLGRATLLDPALGGPREWRVPAYVFAGRLDHALAAAEEAVAADPLSASARAEMGRVLLVLGRCDEALAEVLPLTRLQPPLLRAGPIAAQCYAQRGRWEDALEQASLGGEASGVRGRAWRGYVLGRAGRTTEATQVLDELQGAWSATGTGAFFVAMVLTGLNRPDEACEWLWRALDDHTLSFEVREPAFDSLRSHLRCQELFRRLDTRAQ